MESIKVGLDVDKDAFIESLTDYDRDEVIAFIMQLDEYMEDWDFTRRLYKKLSIVMEKCPKEEAE
jgi:hypothetical protein